VNGFRPRWKSGQLQKAIVKLSADVLHLTETRTDMAHIDSITEVKAFLLSQGYRYAYWTWCTSTARGGYGYAGSAVFCRVKPSSVSFGLGSTAGLDEEGRIITAVFDDTTMVCCYSPCSVWGPTPDGRRTKFDQSLSDRLTKYASKKFVVLGDLNVAPTSANVQKSADQDIADISSCKPAERTAYTKNLHDTRPQDAYRCFHPEPSADDWT
jgi:exodeoxyribonuclease III